MNFLLDENIPPSVISGLFDMGHTDRNVILLGLAGTDDLSIFQLVEKTAEVIITHDNDFGTIHAFSGKVKPSVMFLRHKQINAKIVCDTLHTVLPNLLAELATGIFVTVDELSIRIRPLPINTRKRDQQP